MTCDPDLSQLKGSYALLHALAALSDNDLIYIAPARGVRLTEVESTLEGDMDVRGAWACPTTTGTASR